MINSAIYSTRDNKTISVDFSDRRRSVPNDPRNPHRKKLAEWESQGNTIAPYLQSIEELRREKKQAIASEAIARMSAQVAAINSLEMVDFMEALWPMLDTSAAGAAILLVKGIRGYAKSRLSAAETATREQLEAYDPTTDNGWP